MSEINEPNKKETEKSSADSLDKLLNIFPEIYYDFIGRIIPGALVLMLISFVTSGSENLTISHIFDSVKSFGWEHLSVIVFGGYVIGFGCAKIWLLPELVLTGIGEFISENPYFIKPLKLDQRINGVVRKTSEMQIIIKIMAELALFENLFTGWLLVSILYSPCIDSKKIFGIPVFNGLNFYIVILFFVIAILHHYLVLSSRINSLDQLKPENTIGSFGGTE